MEKRNLIIYWLSTALMCFGMLGSGFAQIFQAEDMVALMEHVGYPMYFLYIIGIWKVLGVIAVLLPKYPLLKEWAYAGFFFVMTGAFFSHLAMGDGFKELVGPIFQTAFIITSWYFRPQNRKLNIITS